MEFNEKLQELRKNKGLTQEELAEILYVSRTAISKWESGRGYPNIESLKELSKFFEVSIDDLLSGEKLLSIAEKENKSNIRNICDLLFGIVDLFSFILVVLPLYPNTIDGFVYSVNLLNYYETTSINLVIYWVMFISLFVVGLVKLIETKLHNEKANKFLQFLSIVINVFMVIFLSLTREAYAVVIAFLLLIVKGGILLKYSKSR
ncbi:MAG: helix-turn-helix transcriptional regulator [Ruminococcaceae bacterium]|nr:helix-turn-helix transcriptional regulator [Oscillospiraceae bacterium]